MKVRCIDLLSASDEAIAHPWLRIGKEYVVLSIFQNAQGERYYRIAPHRDDAAGSLGLFSADSFEVTDDAWPRTWVEQTVNGDLSVAPKAWQHIGFWDDFYDGDAQAEGVFMEERDKILNSES